MTSMQGNFKAIKTIPTDARNFVPISSLLYPGGINALNEANATLTTAGWALNPAIYTAGGVSQGTKYASSINGPGVGKLRDMGKTYVSSSRVFRKVQLIVPNAISTFGVEGNSNAQQPTYPYLTGYVELGWEGAGVPAPIARAP